MFRVSSLIFYAGERRDAKDFSPPSLFLIPASSPTRNISRVMQLRVISISVTVVARVHFGPRTGPNNRVARVIYSLISNGPRAVVCKWGGLRSLSTGSNQERALSPYYILSGRTLRYEPSFFFGFLYPDYIHFRGRAIFIAPGATLFRVAGKFSRIATTFQPSVQILSLRRVYGIYASAMRFSVSFPLAILPPQFLKKLNNERASIQFQRGIPPVTTKNLLGFLD